MLTKIWIPNQITYALTTLVPYIIAVSLLPR